MTFEELVPETAYAGPGGGGYYNGASAAGGAPSGWFDGSFVTSGARFANGFRAEFGDWIGFAYSSTADALTPGWGNQYSAWPGSGANGSVVYAVAYASDAPVIDLPPGYAPASVMLANTTYAALSMRDGDGFAKKFGGADGTDPDYLLLTLTGMAGGGETGSVEVALADFRPADSGEDFVLDGWAEVDLTGLGAAERIVFSFASSDVGDFGINTPTYVALDDLVLRPVPEPGVAVLLAAGAVSAIVRRRRKRPLTMRRMQTSLLAIGMVASGAAGLRAGPFPGAAGEPGSDAVPADDPRIVAWATSVADHQPGSNLGQGFGSFPEAGLGWANSAADGGEADCAATVSLGRGGAITLAFPQPVADRTGDDFAVFENGFDDAFLELAFVEVSGDGGKSFVRFPTRSLTSREVGPFDAEGVDPTEIDGFAGKYRAGFGTPFDLADVGLATATHVRLVDVVGGGSEQDVDSTGAPVFDPYPTEVSAGFDLDAVAVLHSLVPYGEWAGDDEALADPAGDADGDGAVNLLEFALASDPHDGGSLPAVEIAPGALRFPVDLLRGGFAVTVEASGDLRSWAPVAERASGTPAAALAQGFSATEDPAGAVAVTWDAGGAPLYLRLSVRDEPATAFLLGGQSGSAPFDPCSFYGAH